MEKNESHEECLKRDALEEMGMDISIKINNSHKT